MKRKVFRLLKKGVLWFIALTVLWVLLYRWVPVPTTTTMLVSNWRTDAPLEKEWISYEEVSPYIPLAIIAAEDQKFPTHNGFDWEGMQAAFRSNQNGGVVRGGSTISQQVAKNVFLWQNKSYIRKGLEVYFTALIEILWSKERILEVYMNVAETGINTFGMEAGAQRYFHKSAKELSPQEAAQLIQVLPSPKRYSTQPSSRSRRIEKQMNNLGLNYLKKLE